MKTTTRSAHPPSRPNYWHTRRLEDVYQLLSADDQGLTTAEASTRLQRFGPNELAADNPTPKLPLLIRQFTNPLVYILVIASAFTIWIGEYTDTAVIMTIVILNAIIGFTQEYKAGEALRALSRLLADKAVVVRDRIELEIPSTEVVPGDLILLASGNKVPADVRLIHCKELRVDESTFTGESLPSSKRCEVLHDEGLLPFERKNMVFMGTVISVGRGRGIAVATGRDTELGLTSEEVRTVAQTSTPLQKSMASLTNYILFTIAAFSALALAWGAAQGQDLSQLVLALVALAVGAVPEGLPIALTIALSVAVARMARVGAITRRLPAIETLGSATVIASDKTGTLTRNQMTVTSIWTEGMVFTINGVGYDPTGSISCKGRAVENSIPESLRRTLRIGVCANESELIREDGLWAARGDPTEVALIVAARRAGIIEEEERSRLPQIDIVPFESERGYMASLHIDEGKSLLMVKGSPERLLQYSTSFPGINEPVEMARSVVAETNDRLADEGLRVLGMAYKELPDSVLEVTHSDISDLTFAGLQAMMDPPRVDAIEAVGDAKRSGIRVMMITGDNQRTALAIGKKMGIASAKDRAVTGHELDLLDDSALDHIVRKVNVFARMGPNHKHRIAEILKSQNEVVAMTGDGVNDAPALKSADIGVAMGQTGTDAAKEASDIVITDDDFTKIFMAVIEGRVSFDNIRKVTYFLLTSGLGELIAVTATILMSTPLIYLPTQILWLNLVTNGLQDVALAFEPAEKDTKTRAPRNPSEGVLGRVLTLRLLVVGTVIGLSSLIVFLLALNSDVPLDQARTIALTTMVFGQFFHAYNARSANVSAFKMNPMTNKLLLVSMTLAVFAQLALIYTPFMQNVFHTTGLTFTQLLTAFIAATPVIILSELDKLRANR